MATKERRRPVNLPIRIKFAINSGYSAPAKGDKVYLSGNMECNKVGAGVEPPAFLGEVFDPTADGEIDEVIVEVIHTNVDTVSSGAAVSAVGVGVWSGQKVITYVDGSHDDACSKVLLCNTTSGADEDVVVLYPHA